MLHVAVVAVLRGGALARHEVECMGAYLRTESRQLGWMEKQKNNNQKQHCL